MYNWTNTQRPLQVDQKKILFAVFPDLDSEHDLFLAT